MSYGLVPAYIGDLCSKNEPALWCPTWATDANDEVHVLVRDPSQGKAPFAHVPARTLWEKEHEYNLKYNEIVLSFPARQILHYYMGQHPKDLPQNTIITSLYHAKAPIFSGPEENQQISIASVCLGFMHKELPKILKTTEGGTLPDTVKKEGYVFADDYKDHVRWVSFKDIMENICYQDDGRPFVDRLPEALYAPDKTPFKIGGDINMKLQGSVLFAYEQLNKNVLRPLGLAVEVTPSTITNEGKEPCGRRVLRPCPPEGTWIKQKYLDWATYKMTA